MTACCRMGRAALFGIAALFSTTFGASAASAANHDVVTGPSWTGFYFGGFLGAGDVTHEVTTGLLPGLGYDGLGGEGIFGGLMGGYNHQISNGFVLGIQGEFAFSGISSDLSLSVPDIGSGSAKLEEQYSAAVSGRIGWLSNPGTMLYLIGGYSYARYKASGQAHIDIDDGVSLSMSRKESFHGYHVGAGMETRITPAISARVEYRYTDLGREDWGTGDIIRSEPSSHTGRIGLVWNLGSELAAQPAADLPPPASDWTGFYLGTYLGGGAATGRVTSTVVAGSADGLGGEGIHGGFMAGYNYQMNGPWVIGLQGEFGLTDITSDLNLGIITAEAGPTYTVSVSGRLGWLTGPDTMLYMLAGYTHARYKLKINVPLGSISFKEGYDGFHVGAGMETRLSEHLSARVEYRFTQYGKEDWDTGGIVRIEPSSHKGMVGLVWNF